MKDRTHIEFIKDYIAEVGQGPIEMRQNEIVCKSDAVVALWRRIWRRELTPLRDGKPVKQWRLAEKIDTPVRPV